MTREEAIKTIQKFMGWFKPDSRIYKALKMAIQALSQEPICPSAGVDCEDCPAYEPCDAISRDAVHKILWKAIEDLEDLPSVTQKPIECDNAVNRILQRMWNCRGKHTTSIDKVKMEQIIRDELSSVTHKPIECDDAISRQAVLEMAYDMSEIDGEHFTEPCMVVDVEDIQKLPPVTQKSGKWIKKEDDTCWWYACSECGQEPLQNRWNDDDVLSSFCPNCGARMESDVIDK